MKAAVTGCGLALPLPQLSAEPLPVQHKEGTSHGFLVLRSQQGQRLATGELIQTVEGERVTGELVLHFNDGMQLRRVLMLKAYPV
jgi:hypothetical protein